MLFDYKLDLTRIDNRSLCNMDDVHYSMTYVHSVFLLSDLRLNFCFALYLATYRTYLPAVL